MLAEIEGYRNAIRENNRVPPPERILNDASSWRLLFKEVRTAAIQFSSDNRLQWPKLAAWVDLCEIQSCVFARDWTTVRDLAASLLSRVDDEVVRDEIDNMSAYAQYQLGNTSAAMDLLNSVLGGRHSEALVVNASVVACELGLEYAAALLACR